MDIYLDSGLKRLSSDIYGDRPVTVDVAGHLGEAPHAAGPPSTQDDPGNHRSDRLLLAVIRQPG
jgi:hypothetical protein